MEWKAGRQRQRQWFIEEGKACCVYLTFPQLQVRLDVKIGGSSVDSEKSVGGFTIYLTR